MASVYGIDVSSFNIINDWQQVKNAGKEFCIIQAGNDNTGQNTMLMSHYNGCQSVGIGVGLYWFCYALTPQDAYNNGALCGQIITQNNLRLTYPVYYDVERTGYYDYRAGSVENWINHGITPTPAFARSIIEGFAAGLASQVSNQFGVYFNQGMWYEFDYSTLLSAHPNWSRWIAQWDPYPPTSWTTWDIWQYGQGPIPGHYGDCDLNVLYEGYVPPGPGPTPTPSGNMPFWFYLKYPF